MPNGVAYDAAGNLYFADTNRHQVYESSLSGVLSIVAGSGVQGFAGDGGPATGAQLNSPQGVAIGSDGTLYIADTGNQRIRTVIDGQIGTFAGIGVAAFSGDGNSATAASLNNPTALAIDATGALLVCDTANHRIRRISDGVINTIAGSGVQGYAGDGSAATTAELDTPEGVAVGPDGRVYIADSHNDRIRVVATDGTIGTFAGTGIRGYTGDGSVATAAELALPNGLILTSAGTLYFADTNNQRVRTVDTLGIIATVVGSGVQGGSPDASPASISSLDTPKSVSLSTFGSPVFADTGNPKVREVLGNGYLYLPAGLALGRSSTISLNANSTATYGQLSATAAVVGAAGTPQGTVELLENASPGAQVPLVAGAASFPGTLAVGEYSLSASYQGDGVNPSATSNVVTVNIGAATVTATASPADIEYGQAIPALTGTLSGILPQDAQDVTAVFTTAATTQSAPGVYPIVAALTGSASSNYTLLLSPASGSLTINQADSLTAEQPLTQSSYAGLPLVLSAGVTSTTTGMPTGVVNFSDSGVVVASATLAGGSASATYLSPTAGSHSIVAAYLGNVDYNPSSSLPVTTIVGAMPDFSLAVLTASQTAQAGTVVTFNITVAAQPAPFTGVVYLSVGGLPSGATATFSPPQTVPGVASATVVMSVQTVASFATQNKLRDRNSIWPTMLMIPIAFAIRRRRSALQNIVACILLLSLASGAGCGARTVSTAALAQQSYTLQITGTATNLAGTFVTHSAQTVLIVQ